MPIEFVNRTYGGADETATTIAAAAANHTAGNLLVVLVGDELYTSTHNAISSIADTAGNTYTYITRIAYGSVGAIEIWYAKNINGNASNVVTATYSATQYYRRINVLQYSGCDKTTPYDVNGTGSGTGTAGTTSSATTTADNEVIVAGYGEQDVTNDAVAGTGFTLRSNGDSEGPWGWCSEDRIVSSIASYNSEMTLACNEGWFAVHATFKAAEAGITHTFVNKSQANAQTGNPITHNHTPGSAATVAILSIVVEGATQRTGGAPTIDGTTATQADTGRVGVENNEELWYVCKAFSGSLFAVSVPNSGGLTCHIEVVTAYAGSGYTSAYYSANGNVQSSGNGFTITTTQLEEGDFKYTRLGCGENALGSITPTWTGKVDTYLNDHGTNTSMGHYLICGASNADPSWVWSADDGCASCVTFKLVAGGAPSYPIPECLNSYRQMRS